MQVSGGTWRIGLQRHAGPGGQFSVRGLGQQPEARAGSPPKPCVVHLQDFKLDFGNSQGKAREAWHGGMATVFQSPGDKGWGAVWKMNKSNLSSLDKQEGVNSGIGVNMSQ